MYITIFHWGFSNLYTANIINILKEIIFHLTKNSHLRLTFENISFLLGQDNKSITDLVRLTYL